jgi:cell division protease FtsH
MSKPPEKFSALKAKEPQAINAGETPAPRGRKTWPENPRTSVAIAVSLPKTIMNAMQNQQQLDFLVQRASEILRAPGKAITLDCVFEAKLMEFARLESRTGLAGGAPVITFLGYGRGHGLVAGMELYRLSIGETTVRFVRVYDQLSGRVGPTAQDFCVVPAEHYTRFYRFVREKIRRDRGSGEPAPIMPEERKDRLWQNTVGFLTRGREQLKQFGVPQKRGVLLMGEPGNGKTMACRWLRNECFKAGLQWRLVRSECYERTRADGDLTSLFSLDEPGVILFDDFDLGVRNREEFGPTSHHSTFLGELDGVDARDGVVFIFTTNARLTDLDAAFLRPGRIDYVAEFPSPDDELRRRVMREHWHEDIRLALDVESMVAATDGLSFAELAEIKKLLVLRFLDSNVWDWDWAWKTFHADVRQAKPGRPVIGFVHAAAMRRQTTLPTPLLNERAERS